VALHKRTVSHGCFDFCCFSRRGMGKKKKQLNLYLFMYLILFLFFIVLYEKNYSVSSLYCFYVCFVWCLAQCRFIRPHHDACKKISVLRFIAFYYINMILLNKSFLNTTILYKYLGTCFSN